MLLGAVFTAMSTQVAHAGHYEASPPAITLGDGTADVDHFSEPHYQEYIGVGAQTIGDRTYPKDTCTKRFDFTWVRDGIGDASVAPDMNVRHDYATEGGDLTGTIRGNGSRVQASATLSPAGTIYLDTDTGATSVGKPQGGPEFLGVYHPDANGVISVTVTVSAEGTSHLTAAPGGWAKTDMKGLRITSFRVVISPVEVLGGGPEA